MKLNESYTIAEESIGSITDLWHDGANRLNWDCLFVLPGWLKAWWQAFGSGQTPYLCSVHRSGELIGIAPLMVEGETACLMGNTDVCDFLDVVAVPGREEDFLGALFSHLRKQGIRRINLETVRANSTLFRHLTPAVKSRDFTTNWQSVDATMVLELPDSWDAYLERLTGKQRHEVRRKFRRLEEAGRSELCCVEDSAEIHRAMDTFLALFKRNREDKARFMSEQMASFFHSLAAELTAARILKLFFLKVDDIVAAGAMCLDYNRTFYLYNNGYDHKYQSLSVGLLSKLLTIKESILRGKKKYDFLKGTEDYKHRLGAARVPLYCCRVDLD